MTVEGKTRRFCSSTGFCGCSNAHSITPSFLLG
jgi:hypothetical protein